jgi:hypothetical protein
MAFSFLLVACWMLYTDDSYTSCYPDFRVIDSDLMSTGYPVNSRLRDGVYPHSYTVSLFLLDPPMTTAIFHFWRCCLLCPGHKQHDSILERDLKERE